MTDRQIRETTRRASEGARRAMAKFFEAYGLNERMAKKAAEKAVDAAMCRAADAMLVLDRA